METYRIENYNIVVETNQTTRPGDDIVVTIKSNRANAQYASVYSLMMYPDDTARDLAKRAFIHFKMGTKPDTRVPIAELSARA